MKRVTLNHLKGVLICSDFFSKTLLLEELFMTRLWTPKVWHPRFLFFFQSLQVGFPKVMQLSLKRTAKMAPENRPKLPQKETIVFRIPTIHFQVQAVSFREGNFPTGRWIQHLPGEMCDMLIL